MALKYAIIRVNDHDPDDVTVLLQKDMADSVAASAHELAWKGRKARHAKIARRAFEHATAEAEAELKQLTISLP